MKALRIIILTLVIACLLVFSVSCSKKIDEISNIKLDEDTLTITWDRVYGAKDYTVSVSGQEYDKTSRNNKYSLEYLDPGVYEIKIKANGDGVESKDSDWVVYEFEREKESGLKYKLINNNTEYQLISLGSASGDVVMDDTYRGKPVTSIADKAFSGNNRVTSFVVGKNVKSIGKSAFARCAELTSITIGENVTSIGSSCFQSCKKLTSITLPNSVTVIEDYLFSWCSALESITLGNATKIISMYAFSSCKALESITLPDTVTLIEEYAFSDCESLATADLGNSLETIQPYAFYNCLVLAEPDLGDSLKTIDEYAFGNCDAIVEIDLPDTVEYIGFFAFRYCDNLESITLSPALTYIGGGAFYNTKLYMDAGDDLIVDGWYINCKNKERASVTLPAGVYGIADSAFYGCKKITVVNYTGVKYVCNNAFSGCVELQYAIFNSDLRSIGAYGFKGCKKLINVIIGSKLESIGDYAFSGCEKLQPKKVTQDYEQRITAFPETLTSVGVGAFKKINATAENGLVYVGNWLVGVDIGPGSGLTDVPVKSGTVGIANYTFSSIPIMSIDPNAYTVKLPSSLKIIGRGAFYKATASGYAVNFAPLPTGLKYIGDYAFYGDYAAFFGQNRTLVIPEGTEYIGRSAFYGCESIYSLSISGTVKSIGDYAFYGCVNIGGTIEDEDDKTPDIKGYFEILDGLETTIGSKSFYGCTSIESITIPDSVTSIGARSFYKCTGLKSLTLGSGITEIPDYAFYNCQSLESLVIPDSITAVGNYAFRGCAALKSLTLGSSLTSIGNFAFLGAENLSVLAIPDSVTSIGMHAFRGMARSKTIILPTTVNTIGIHAFYGAPNTIIYLTGDGDMKNWNERWNSSYATVITDCVISDEGNYLVSFVRGEENPNNVSVDGTIPTPVRAGYTFRGFSKNPNATEAEYDTKTFVKAKIGTVLYTVWTEENTPNN